MLGSVLLLAAAHRSDERAVAANRRRHAAGGLGTADATRIMGVKACLDCHKPEVAAWQVSRHAVNFDKLGDNPNAKKYAAALGITNANITREGLCINCHGQRAQATANKAVSGVACESCHGAARSGENAA